MLNNMYNAGEDILGAFMRGRSFRQALEEQNWNRQMDVAKMQQQADQFQKQLDWEKEHGRAQLALSKAIQDLQHIQNKAALEEKMGQGLIAPTGVEYRGNGPDPTTVSQLLGEAINSGQSPQGIFQYTNTDLVPGETLRSLPPGETGSAVAAFQEPALRAKANARIGELAQKFLLDSKLEGVKQEGRIAIADKNIQGRKDVADISAEATKEAARIRANATIAAAKLRQNESGMDPSTFEAIGSGLADGTYTVADLVKLGVKGNDRGKLVAGLKEKGIIPLNADQKKALEDMSGIASLFNRMQSFIDSYQPSSSTAGAVLQGTLATLNPDVKAQEGEITGTLGNIARNLGGEKGMLSNKDIQRAAGLVPSRFYTADVNKRRMDQLKELIGDRANTKLQNIPVDQRRHLFNTYGIPFEAKDKTATPKVSDGAAKTGYKIGDKVVLPGGKIGTILEEVK